MKVGIVVPYSWSFWGGVVEHAEQQAKALRSLGLGARILIGHDPPGRLTRALHPGAGRLEQPPDGVLPLGRSAIVPANASNANILISPSAIARLRRLIGRERFDVLHVHEPLTPVVGAAALAFAETPVVATFHAAGPSRWRSLGSRLWGFLLERVDYRIAVSESARATASGYAPGEYEIVPNGVVLPEEADPDGRRQQVVYVGRHDPRKGLAVLLACWPEVYERTGARLRVIGADPLAVRLLMSRHRLQGAGVDVLGVVGERELTEELLQAKALVAPSLGAESFGMVLTRALACATPVVASDIDGYRTVVDAEVGILVPPGARSALGDAVVELLEDEPRRRALAERARRRATRYSWAHIAERLAQIYADLIGARPVRRPPVEEAAVPERVSQRATAGA